MKSKKRFVTIILVIFLLVIIFKNLYPEETQFDKKSKSLLLPKIVTNLSVFVEKKVTLLLRYTSDRSNYLSETVKSFTTLFPQMSIVIVCDTIFRRVLLSGISDLSHVNIIPLKLDLLNVTINRKVEDYLKTKYLLIVPLGILASPAKTIVNLIDKLNEESNASFLTIPVKDVNNVKCLDLNLNLIQWTMEYKTNYFSSICNAVKGEHAIFTSTKTFKKISDPFMLPFPEPLYIQATVLNLKVKVLNDIFFKRPGANVLDTISARKIQIQRQIMNQNLKIKKVIRETGLIEWYGCSRDTHRCFGDVIDLVPEYLNEGRWTPPCCLRVLRETVHHVFKILRDFNITFWLEGGSLLGAMRMKDIIPWDYDVDIGMYSREIPKCPWLKALQDKKFQEESLLSVFDDKGFLWEKSAPEEGEFFRVQASANNRLHVDIFPFESARGVMTKGTWFANHPQDREFPEHYLQPLTTIEFAGIEAPAPNNIREFLELKFGKGCVENPQYPNPKLITFPGHLRHLALLNETKGYEV